MTTTTSATPSPATDEAEAADRALTALLDDELAFSPLARPPYISHLAMGLVAARRLGATAEELRERYEAEVADGYLVARERPEWLGPEARRIVEAGIGVAVAAELPMLLHAPSAQFFHAAIRLELAIDAQHPGQVANALANWRDAARPLAELPAGSGRAPFAEVMAELTAPVLAGAAEGRSTWEVATAPWFRAALDELRDHDGLLDEVSAVVAAAHTDPHNFGTLHLVTGVRAMQALAPLTSGEDRRALALRTAQAVAAAQATFGGIEAPIASEAEARRRGPHPSWDVIARAVLATGDAHAAKLTYACWLEEERTGDLLLRDVARRQAGL